MMNYFVHVHSTHSVTLHMMRVVPVSYSISMDITILSKPMRPLVERRLRVLSPLHISHLTTFHPFLFSINLPPQVMRLQAQGMTLMCLPPPPVTILLQTSARCLPLTPVMMLPRECQLMPSPRQTFLSPTQLQRAPRTYKVSPSMKKPSLMSLLPKNNEARMMSSWMWSSRIWMLRLQAHPFYHRQTAWQTEKLSYLEPSRRSSVVRMIVSGL